MKASRTVVTTLRLPEPLLERVDALVEVLRTDPEWQQRGIHTRTLVLRECIIRGLDALELLAKR